MKSIVLKNHFFRYTLTGCFLIVLVLLFPLAQKSWSKQPQINDILVTNNQDHLLVYFITRGCFTPEMNQAIKNGIPTTFTFLVELYKPRSLWPNKKLATLKLYHTIKYDSLRDEYSVMLSERGNQTFIIKEYAKAQEMMADVSNIRLTPLQNLERNIQYRLRIKAELNKVRLPLYLHYILFFVSLWDFETDWHVVDFIY